MEPIILKIDVSKIDKNRLFKGAKGTYLDCVAWPTENDQYGNDYRIVESVSKEERDSGVKGTILGNGKLMNKGKSQQPPHRSAPPQRREQAKYPTPQEAQQGTDWDDPDAIPF